MWAAVPRRLGRSPVLRRCLIDVGPYLGQFRDQAVAHGDQGRHAEVLLLPSVIPVARPRPTARSPASTTSSHRNFWQPGLGVQTHEIVASEVFSGMHVVAPEVRVEQSRELVLAVAAEDVAKTPQQVDCA